MVQKVGGMRKKDLGNKTAMVYTIMFCNVILVLVIVNGLKDTHTFTCIMQDHCLSTFCKD